VADADPRRFRPGLRAGRRHRHADQPDAAFRFGEKADDPLSMYLSLDIFTVTINLAGLPGISIPCGLTPGALPIGLQIVGRRFDEETVLRLAAALEGTIRFRESAALLPVPSPGASRLEGRTVPAAGFRAPSRPAALVMLAALGAARGGSGSTPEATAPGAPARSINASGAPDDAPLGPGEKVVWGNRGALFLEAPVGVNDSLRHDRPALPHRSAGAGRPFAGSTARRSRRRRQDQDSLRPLSTTRSRSADRRSLPADAPRDGTWVHRVAPAHRRLGREPVEPGALAGEARTSRLCRRERHPESDP